MQRSMLACLITHVWFWVMDGDMMNYSFISWLFFPCFVYNNRALSLPLAE